ncbi:hypothetical protein CPB86DRAFT_133110 [Serendipita vermifera]|nr:hypothetical protein CPB86DRAFT_133110 [Serendipita vermifera]
MQEKVPNGHSTRPTNLTMNVNRMDQTGPVAFDTNILENISPCCPAKGPPSYISPLVLSSIPREEKGRPTEANLMLYKGQTYNEDEENGLPDQVEKPILTDERSLEATPKGSDKKHVKVISLSSFIKQRNMRRASRSGSKHQGASVSHEPTAFDLGDMFGEENAYPVPALSKPLSIASDQGRSQFPDAITSSMTSRFLPSSVDTESDLSG